MNNQQPMAEEYAEDFVSELDVFENHVDDNWSQLKVLQLENISMSKLWNHHQQGVYRSDRSRESVLSGRRGTGNHLSIYSRPTSKGITHSSRENIGRNQSFQLLEQGTIKKQFDNLVKKLKAYKETNEILQSKLDSTHIDDEVNNLRAIIKQQKQHVDILREDNDRMAGIIRRQEKDLLYIQRIQAPPPSYSQLETEMQNLVSKNSRLQVYLKRKQTTERSLIRQIKDLEVLVTDMKEEQVGRRDISPLKSLFSIDDEDTLAIQKLTIDNATLSKSVHKFREVVFKLQQQLRLISESKKGAMVHIEEVRVPKLRKAKSRKVRAADKTTESSDAMQRKSLDLIDNEASTSLSAPTSCATSQGRPIAPPLQPRSSSAAPFRRSHNIESALRTSSELTGATKESISTSEPSMMKMRDNDTPSLLSNGDVVVENIPATVVVVDTEDEEELMEKN